MITNHVKYPRTFHLPWSLGRTDDDKVMWDTSLFESREPRNPQHREQTWSKILTAVADFVVPLIVACLGAVLAGTLGLSKPWIPCVAMVLSALVLGYGSLRESNGRQSERRKLLK